MKNTIFIICVVSFFLLYSCENKNILHFNRTESQIIDTFSVISVLHQITYNDSIVINRWLDNKMYKDTYLKSKNNVFDVRQCGYLYERQDTVLLFSNLDTTFLWNDEMPFMPYLIGMYKNSCVTNISKISENLFKTTLISYIDTTLTICNKRPIYTYKEIYYYNNNFKISRVEYYYKNSRVVLD
jgi:hypothetical protein